MENRVWAAAQALFIGAFFFMESKRGRSRIVMGGGGGQNFRARVKKREGGKPGFVWGGGGPTFQCRMKKMVQGKKDGAG